MSAFAAHVSRAGERPLSRAESERAFGILLDGAADDEEIGAFLTALATRGETADEIAGAASAMRARAVPVAAPAGAIDTCGTGGDGARTLNISTAVAFVAAGAGAIVAKHGNRAASSASGSSDVLAALGLRIDADPVLSERALREARCAFLFAQRHHPALARIAPIRKKLGIRTMFNLVGPLANPAMVRRHVVGVASPALIDKMTAALAALGAERAFVVHGSDGLDEATLSGPTDVAELRSGAIRRFTIVPGDAGLSEATTDAVRGGGPAENAAALARLLDGERSAYRDIVLLNTALALMAAELAQSPREGASLAAAAIDNGRARMAFETLKSIVNP